MVKRFDRVLLYVGAAKTGTTSIQHFLITNEALLRSQGFYIPNAGRRGIQHLELPTVFGRQRPHLDRLSGIEGNAEARREQVRRELAAELSTVGSGHTLLVFSEHMFHADTAEIAAYRDLFAPYARRLESLMYLRRQDRWLISRTLQARKTGVRRDIRLTPSAARQFDADVRCWDAASDVCHVRRFDTELLADGLLIEDFCRTIGADSRGLVSGSVRNRSILQEQLELVDALNRALDRPAALQSHYRSPFIELCSETLGGHRIEYSRGVAEAAFHTFESTNRWLAETRDPRGPTLFFNTDFSDYPAVADNSWSYSNAQLVDLRSAIHRLLLGQGSVPSPLPPEPSRGHLIDQIVADFIRLRDLELKTAGTARRSA